MFWHTIHKWNSTFQNDKYSAYNTVHDSLTILPLRDHLEPKVTWSYILVEAKKVYEDFKDDVYRLYLSLNPTKTTFKFDLSGPIHDKIIGNEEDHYTFPSNNFM